MKIIAVNLLFTCIGFLHFKRADGFPANHIFIEMTDHSTFEGMITPFTHRDLPLWMQPGHARHVLDFFVFIRTEIGTHFTSIVTTTNRPFNHDPHPNGPVYAELRLGNGECFVAVSFQVYVPRLGHTQYQPNLPPKNQIYIAVKHGPVYSAVLEKYNSPEITISETYSSSPGTSHSSPTTSH